MQRVKLPLHYCSLLHMLWVAQDESLLTCHHLAIKLQGRLKLLSSVGSALRTAHAAGVNTVAVFTPSDDQ
jgi:hypothetical protein